MERDVWNNYADNTVLLVTEDKEQKQATENRSKLDKALGSFPPECFFNEAIISVSCIKGKGLHKKIKSLFFQMKAANTNK